MTMSRTSEPFDEHALRVLFENVEPPAEVGAGWRDRAKGAAPAKGRRAARIFRRGDWFRRLSRPWLRVLAAGVAATATAGVVGVVAANRPDAPEPDPDKIETIINLPPSPSLSAVPPTSASAPGAPSGTQPVPGGPGTVPGSAGGLQSASPAGPAAPAPARGPLAEWPDAGNTGIPSGTRLSSHAGDLHVTQAGELVTDMRVSGVIYVDAPDVTLRRVQANRTIQQRAPRLRVEDSEITGGQIGILQQASGLTVQRSHIHDVSYAVVATTDVTIVDNYLPGNGSRVVTNGNTARLTVRHNNFGAALEVTDQDGPVTDVTIENNQLTFLWAPSGGGSHDIRVTGNQFRRTRPDDPAVSGWNPGQAGNVWTGNVWFGTSDPANP
ncbi:MAG TPA: hypothetical protein VGR06_39475 [Actinophytocola sp.]|uniref:hypothetical protein n=1 Tax=Actinophytocola sp. TaxID=1872138 RepID=UPI002E003989|nr:hypothetical protein [Actinophytocola sp.]